MVERFSGEWKEAKLGEIGTFIKGANLSKADISVSGTPLILYGELYTTYKEVAHEVYRRTRKTVNSKHYSRVGDVIIPTSSEVADNISSATCVMIPGVILAGDLCIFRTSKLDGRFLSFALNHVVKNQIAEIAQGITIIHVRIKDLENITVRFPPLEEQHAIADTLSAFDRHISALSALIAKKQAIRQGALEDLMTGRTRLEGFCGSWKTVKLGELGKVRMCRRVFQSQTKPYGQVPFFKIGTFNSEPDAYITRELFNEYRRLYPYPKKGHVLLSAAGTIGRTMLFDGRDAYFQDSNIVWLDADSGKVDGRFLMYFYQTYPWRNLEGTTIKRLYNSLILDTPINLPPMDEQLAISSVLSALDSELSALNSERSKFSAIRQAAVSDLLTGKIRLERTAH